jgi:hypothetical protein
MANGIKASGGLRRAQCPAALLILPTKWLKSARLVAGLRDSRRYL